MKPEAGLHLIKAVSVKSEKLKVLHKTQGIVFRFTKYGETSIIVNIFTSAFGLQSYMVNGVRSKSSTNKIALYQPMTLLDLVVYHRENANIQRIKEVKCIHPYHSIQQDVRKSAVAMFLNELLNKAVKDQSHTEDICGFLIDSLIALDQLPSVANFHLVFMVKLSRFLGFGPQTVEEVMEGWPATPQEEEKLQFLFTANFDQDLPMDSALRRNLMEILLTFYKRHVENFGTMHSVEVLKEVFTSPR